MNPCDTNLYSTFVRSSHSCDQTAHAWFYYTCESFEAMAVFDLQCATHEPLAKIDMPRVTMSQPSPYGQWQSQVMSNRRLGKGRDIVYDDHEMASPPGMGGSSLGGGGHGHMPVSDEALGNVRDDEHFIDSHKNRDWARKEQFADVYVEQQEERVEAAHQRTLEVMVVGVWAVVFSVVALALCCLMALCAGVLVRRWRKARQSKGRVSLTPNGDELEEQDCLEEEMPLSDVVV